jgi:hypothetical protein
LTPEAVEGLYRDTARDLARLQQELGSNRDIAENVRDLVRQMQGFDPSRLRGNAEMLEQLHAQVLASIEHLEMQLRRAVEDAQGGSVRTGNRQPAPPGYDQAVADYFRKLSKDTK